MRNRRALWVIASSLAGCTQPPTPPATNAALAEFQSAERDAYAAYQQAIRPYAQRVVDALDAEIARNVDYGDNPHSAHLRSIRREYEGITKQEFLRTDVVGVYEFLDEKNEPGDVILRPDGSYLLRLGIGRGRERGRS